MNVTSFSMQASDLSTSNEEVDQHESPVITPPATQHLNKPPPPRPPPPKPSSRQKSPDIPEDKNSRIDPVYSREISPEVIPRTTSQGESVAEETVESARLKKQPSRPQIPKRPASVKKQPAQNLVAARRENKETVMEDTVKVPSSEVTESPKDQSEPAEASRMSEETQEVVQRPVAAPRTPSIKPRTKVKELAETSTEQPPIETEPKGTEPESDKEGQQNMEDEDEKAVSASVESPAITVNYESQQEGTDVTETSSGNEDVMASELENTESPTPPAVSPSHSTPQPKPRSRNPSPATQSSAKPSPKASPRRPPQRPPAPSAKKTSKKQPSPANQTEKEAPIEEVSEEPLESRDKEVATATEDLVRLRYTVHLMET